MSKKTMGVFLLLIEYGVLVLLCLGVDYSSDYTFRFLVLYFICQTLFGHYRSKSLLIWDEIRLLIISHISFYTTSLILLPIMNLSYQLVIKNLMITCFMFVFDILMCRHIRIILNKQVAERVMIVGVGKEAKTLATICETNRFAMMNVTCIIDPNGRDTINSIKEIKSLRDHIYPLTELVDRIKKDKITELILAEPNLPQEHLDKIVGIANHYVKKIKFVPRIKDLVTFDTAIQDLDGLLVISKTNEKKSITKNVVKRFIDICMGLCGFMFLLPLTLYVRHVNHKNGDYEPVYFKQERIGKDGKMFVMYKFRTMVPHAEDILKDLMEQDPLIKEEYTKNKKLKEDPRITKAGHLLRKRSLDEFPQFINVLKGEMSIVGPRPYLPREKEDMCEYYDSIIMSKPGITGMWQSHGRNDVGFRDRCVMDDYYNRNWSLWLDTTILIKTLKSVLVKDGAF